VRHISNIGPFSRNTSPTNSPIPHCWAISISREQIAAAGAFSPGSPVKSRILMRSQRDLTGLIKFLARDDWKSLFEEVLGEHFGPAMQAFDLEYEAIGAALGADWDMILWGVVFEDFLGRQLEPDGRNFVDEYLRRRGWNESVPTKAYLRGLRHSIMSLYETSAGLIGSQGLATSSHHAQALGARLVSQRPAAHPASARPGMRYEDADAANSSIIIRSFLRDAAAPRRSRARRRPTRTGKENRTARLASRRRRRRDTAARGRRRRRAPSVARRSGWEGGDNLDENSSVAAAS
jgi:hypothetical protein